MIAQHADFSQVNVFAYMLYKESDMSGRNQLQESIALVMGLILVGSKSIATRTGGNKSINGS